MKQIREIIRGNSTSGLQFISKQGSGELVYDSTLHAFRFTEDVVNKYGLPISGGTIPNATATEVGGIKMRVDTVTGTLYITNDGTNP